MRNNDSDTRLGFEVYKVVASLASAAKLLLLPKLMEGSELYQLDPMQISCSYKVSLILLGNSGEEA